MRIKHISLYLFTVLFYLSPKVSAQHTVAPAADLCHTSEAMKAYYDANPSAKKANEEFELFTQKYIHDLEEAAKKMTTTDTFFIPVVFHVYGNNQGGYPISNPLIQLALKGVNDDFNALNADYNTVHNQFLSVRSSLKIKFVLAQKDPSGSTTTGVVYYPSKAGYGNGSGYDAQIAADAWDNYKYMNVYIMNDLYNNSVYNNSGVSWYPDATMSNNKTARVVYNGAYLATNNTVNPEFASVLTHEFGHFLNLIHTFEGGCTAPNDNVADTPPCTQAQGCHTSSTANAPLNCNSVVINAENYMDYNTTCYKMFTAGQTARMTAALQHPARITLWQDSTLTATGIKNPAGVNPAPAAKSFNVYPNPSYGKFYVQIKDGFTNAVCRVTVSDISGRVLLRKTAAHFNNADPIEIDLTNAARGNYLVHISSGDINQMIRISKL